MSVRPVSWSDEAHATGHPWVNGLALFGGLQGMLMYLHRYRMPINQNWFGKPGGMFPFGFYVVGGYLVGGVVAMAFFSDWDTIRLIKSHRKDAALMIETQKY